MLMTFFLFVRNDLHSAVLAEISWHAPFLLPERTPLMKIFSFFSNWPLVNQDLAEYLKLKGADDSLLNGEGLTCYEGLHAQDLDGI